MTTCSLERKINLPVEKVWSLISNFTQSPAPEIKIEVEKEGDPATGGVGAIRMLTIGRTSVREILDTVNPPHSFTYRIIGGTPTKEYKGKVTLEGKGDTTILHWHADIKPIVPLTGGIVCMVAKGVINAFVDALENHNT